MLYQYHIECIVEIFIIVEIVVGKTPDPIARRQQLIPEIGIERPAPRRQRSFNAVVTIVDLDAIRPDPQCRKFVQRLESLEENVRTFQQEVAGRVQVASIYSIGIGYMDQFVKDFLQRNPKANVRLSYHHPKRVYDLVESDQVELGLVSYPKSARNIIAVPWRDEPMVFVCSKDHPLADHETIELDDIGGQDIIAFDEHLKIRQKIDKVLSTHRIEVNVAMEFDNIETLKRAIEINAGTSILPEQTVSREVQSGTLCTARIADHTLVRPVGIIHRRNIKLGRTTTEFIRLLQEQTNVNQEHQETENTAADCQPQAGIAAK